MKMKLSWLVSCTLFMLLFCGCLNVQAEKPAEGTPVKGSTPEYYVAAYI